MSGQVKLHWKVREQLASKCRGDTPARIAKRARVLLCLDEQRSIWETAEIVGCGTATVKRVKRRFREEGWERAIADGPRPGRPRKLDLRAEQELIALACTTPPNGAERWTVRLLAKHFEREISHALVHRVLQEDGLKPWREKNVVHSRNRRRVSRSDG